MATLREEIERRRTFAIISHPDVGKTTLTEKLLLYGGAIQTAGSVKGKQSAKHAVSDWMDIEKQRGISVTSSVLQFNYQGKCINILDTPGHQDFSEDTYRTLMAADSEGGICRKTTAEVGTVAQRRAALQRSCKICGAGLTNGSGRGKVMGGKGKKCLFTTGKRGGCHGTCWQ